MSSSDGPDGPPTFATRFEGAGQFGDLETMLFEGLVYQLIEKGLLTKNDALSIVQTVAQVKRSQLDEDDPAPEIEGELALLGRLYESFEALRERYNRPSGDFDNIRQLRPPLHGDVPQFSADE